MPHPRPLVRLSRLVLLGLCACSGGGTHPAPLAPAQPSWSVRSTPTGGASGRALIVADVDRDGLADVLVANETFASVSVLTARADGTFASGTLVPAPQLVTTIGFADVTGDRNGDLVAASAAVNELTVSAGRGDGTFAAPVAVVLPWAARQLAIVDWTGDGLADVVVASSQTAAIALLPGTGGGGFGAARIAALAFAAADFAVVDCDGDRRPDLVCTGANAGRIDVLRNDGLGAFLPPLTTATEAQGGRFVCCDLDGDRVPEFVGIDGASTTVRVHRGDGAGGFLAGVDVFVAQSRIDSLALGDLSGDGLIDLVVAAGGQLLLAPGDGNAAFGPADGIHTDGAGATWVVAADLLGDGFVELVYLQGSDRIGVLNSLRAVAAGLVSFGAGTPDCAGRIGMWANGAPRLGNGTYGYTTTNAPRDAIGLMLQGGPADLAGSDPLGLGVLLHIGTGLLISDLVFSDHTGAAFRRLPIPVALGLVGLPVHVQTLWLGELGTTCSSSPGGLSSSVGLTSTVQP